MQYSPSERQLRELALACFSNAQEFHEEAFLLAKHNHVRSIALAILGAEEFAKSIAFTVAVFRPDERDTLLNRDLLPQYSVYMGNDMWRAVGLPAI